MLKRLFIQNYALIEHLDLSLKPGFTAVTGETGSGKSILMGAIGLALGDRADTHILFDKELKCVVEVEFDLVQLGLEKAFKSEDIDFYPESTFRREINTSGRSRAFINDTPVSVQLLKGFAQRLVDVHSQHQTLLLKDENFQIGLLDLFCKKSNSLSSYQKCFNEYRIEQAKLQRLKKEIQEQGIDKDYLLFQLDELSSVDLEADADEEIREELGLLENADQIKSTLQAASDRLQTEQGLLDQLRNLSTSIDTIAGHTKGLEELAERIETTRVELDDIAGTIDQTNSSVETNPQKKQELLDTMDMYQRLLNKHRVQSVEELIGLKSDIESRLTRADSAEEELNQCEDKIKALHKKVKEQAERLTSERLKAKSRFISSVSEEFSSLSLPNATIDLNISQSTDYHSFGIDDVNILFNANKGGTLEQLTKVASGGELSRLMLILKQKMAQSIGLPSLIFDEIDTGVSGEIAAQMAKSLLNLSEDRQVIAITHLPQVAGRAMHHLKISKSDTDERSITEVTELDSDGRILELAKMLSGSRISEASVANARELLKN